MKFIIKNGQGLLYIGYHEDGVSYLYFKRPLSVEWYDHGGSIAQYTVLLPYSKEYREQFLNRYREDVHKDYSTDIESLHTLLSPLWSLFENGFYELEYHTIPYNCWDIHYAYDVHIADEDRKKEEYQSYRNERQKRNWQYSSFFDYTTSIFYPFDDFNFFATESKTKLNEERIKYFEERIKKGERPFALVYRAFYTIFDEYSNEYVLDGHHKLEAYKNLKIPPAVAIITQNYILDIEDFWDDNDNLIEEKFISHLGNFDLKVLKESLYPWQFDNIIEIS